MNLGFISANKHEGKVLKPSDNTLFVIKLKKIHDDSIIDYGFVDISRNRKFPEFPDEILINPLNTFTIEKCVNKIIKRDKIGKEKERLIKVVYLRYGSFV